MQHLSALFTDVEIAINSNVISDNTDMPHDVYTEVANVINDIIETLEDQELKIILLKIIKNRKLLKGPVMTVPYNVGLQRMLDQLIAKGFFIQK
jgi:DNA-directed RNA polymerase